jgi:hypothetical protein
MNQIDFTGGTPSWLKILRSDLWSQRLMREREVAHTCWFVTLTFKKEPNIAEALHSMQRYIKRLRKGLRKPVRLPSRKEPVQIPPITMRYFAVMEKGSKNGRLHLHLLMFMQSGTPKAHLEHFWNDGFIASRRADEGSIQYICKYLSKSPVRRNIASTNPPIGYYPEKETSLTPKDNFIFWESRQKENAERATGNVADQRFNESEIPF